MQLLTLVSLVLSAAAVAGQKSHNGSTANALRHNIDNGVIPQQYIVEFADVASLKKRAGLGGDYILVFYTKLRDHGIHATPRLNITSDIFEGVSFHADNATQLEELKALEDVKNVWPVRRIAKPEPIIHSAGASSLPLWTSHANTGVLELHEMGIMGEGATVAIARIDYNHPSLGGGFGAGFKVKGGTDIVGDNYFGNAFFPDNDPLDYAGHGTHVAGIVAASGDDNFVSVAPKAKLLAYKVFGNNYGSTGEDALIAACLKAYSDGADVINASVGSASGWPEDAWATVASRIVEKGIFISISAGNFGETGIWYASSGSSGTEVLAVTSVDSETYIAFGAKVEGETSTDILYLSTKLKAFAINGSIPIHTTSTDITVAEDACTELPMGTNLSGKLVLIRRGGCDFSQKEAVAVAAGAEWIWFYNVPDSAIAYPSIPTPKSKGFAMITAADGEAIVKQIAAGKTVTANFTPGPQTSMPNTVSGGKVSTFSSWGPTNEGAIKPEIAAPGGSIYSTYPLALGGHAVLSGTSMASPYAAGVAALYIAKAGGRAKLGVKGIKELKDRIIASGTLLNYNDGFTTDLAHLAPVAQQGGGYINAKKLFYDTTLSPGKLELNDTQHFRSDHFISVRNAGKKWVVYTLSHEPAATVNTFAAGLADPQTFPPTFVEPSATVRFSTKKVVVPADATGIFWVSFLQPKLDAALLPVYSGKIVVTGSNGEVLSIPYQGIRGNMADINIWDTANGEPTFIDDNTGANLDSSRNFTMDGYDRPAVVLTSHFGSAENRWDVVQSDWTTRDWRWPPKAGKNKFVGSVVDVYDGAMFPTVYKPRTNPLGQYYYYYGWKGALTNGSNVAPGTYRMLLSTLRPFGRREMAADWQMKLSEPITILGK